MKLATLAMLSVLVSGATFAAQKEIVATEGISDDVKIRTRICNSLDSTFTDWSMARDCFHLGEMYETGQGVKRNYFKAVEFYQKACDYGDKEGCYNLGVMYVSGRGVRQNDFKAVDLFSKTCAGGNADGCYNLGVMYIKGRGVRQSKTEALKYYGKACDLKFKLGCENYARLNTGK